MKATRLVEMSGINPAFNPDLHRAALRGGEPYSVPAEITYPAGSTAEGDDVFVHCTCPEPTMVPADEECHERVVRYFSSDKVKDRLQKLQKMATPEVFKHLTPELQHYVRVVSEKWSGSTAEAIVFGEEPLPKKPRKKAAKKATKKKAST